jgi:hypothetical protein
MLSNTERCAVPDSPVLPRIEPVATTSAAPSSIVLEGPDMANAFTQPTPSGLRVEIAAR